MNPHSTFARIENGHGEGRDLIKIRWRTVAGADAGHVEIPITGKGRIGPVKVQLLAMENAPNHAEWDTREWQWWKSYPFEPSQMRPREIAVATGDAKVTPNGIRVWTRFVCDEVETTQVWLFADLERPDACRYDCLITVRNTGKQTLAEYGQFFACYTAWNESNGHFYWGADGKLVNYRDRGSQHLDYYVTAKGSRFDKLKHVPHCPRGGGLVKDVWQHPISISHPDPRGYRHIVMSEEARTAAIAQGMKGIAQDYLIYPPGGDLAPGESFGVHVRHLLVKVPEDELVGRLAQWWGEFVKDHQDVHRQANVFSQPAAQ